MGRPVTVDSLYYPEYVIYVERSGNSVNPSNVFLHRWDKAANGWDPVRRSLSSIGGQAWLAANTGVVQLVVSYTAIGTSADDFVGSVALTVFSSGAGASEGIRDSVPSQGATIDSPAFVSDMLMPLYPFDTPLSNPIVFYELPSLRWRMPYYDSVDGYEVQVGAR